MPLPLKTWKDSPLNNHPEDYAYEFVNAVVTKNLSSITNEPGASEHSVDYNSRNYILVGIKNAKYGDKVVFSIGPDTLSKIGIIKANGTYIEKLSFDLGFNQDYPIDCELYYNFKGELIVAITDNLNTPKLINLDDIQLPFNLNDAQLSASFIQPQVVADVLETGGSVLTGAWFPFFGYKSEDSVTPYTLIENPIYITTSTKGQSSYYEGSPPGLVSSKAISLTVNNVDTSFSKIVLGMIIKIDGILTARLIKELPVSASSMNITYQGSENLGDIDILNVLTPSVNYSKIKHFTQVDGILYGAGVTEETPLNFQQWANLIKLKYTTTLKDFNTLEETYKFNAQNNRMKGFKHEEAYAIYIRLKIKGRGFSEAFHVPGRIAEGIETTLYSTLVGSQYDVQKAISPTAKYYQIDDTSDVNGKLGFWQNENEFYPNTIDYAPVEISPGVFSEDLRNKNIRHHRFPSIKKLKDNTYSATTGYGMWKMDILGLEVDSFPTLPTDLASIVEGYELFYAKRTTNNSLVSGQSIITYMATGRGDGRYFSMGASVDVNERFPNESQTDAWRMKGDRIRFDSLDLLLDKPAINPTYISAQLGMRANNVAANHTIAFDRGADPGDRLYAWDINFMNSNGDTQELGVPTNHKYKRINSFKYIPARTNVDDYVNLMGMETAVAKLTDTAFPNIDFRSIYLYLGNANNSTNGYNFDSTYLVNLMSYKTDVYNSLNSQQLVSTGKYIKIGDSDKKVYGGDIFIGLHSFVSTGLSDYTRYLDGPDDYLNTPQRTLKSLRVYLTEGYNNMSLRYSIAGDERTKYYPKEGVGGNSAWFLNASINGFDNKIGYNKDYTSVNDLNASTIHDPNKQFIAEDPYKIVRSKVPTKEERQSSWKIFLANDYYIIPRDKGFITNIQGVGSELFINCEQAILKTRGSDELATNSFKVVLGTGNIFDRPPIEMIFDEDGYAGCQHKHSCLLTRFGYFFGDEDRKKWFLVNDTVKDVTSGLQNFFRDNMRTTGDNPYRNKGYTVAWDEEFSRIIVSSLEAGFTRHYIPQIEGWVGRSDYYPNIMIGDRNSLYAYKDNKFYKHNDPTKRGIYYDTTIHPFGVVFIVRDKQEQITLFNVNWKTLFTLNGNVMRDNTFDSILIWDGYQATGNISLVPHDSTKSMIFNYENSNIRRIKNLWNFNDIKDKLIVKNTKFINDITLLANTTDNNKKYYLKKPLSDDYMAIKLLFSNQKFSTFQAELQLLDFNINDIKVTR